MSALTIEFAEVILSYTSGVMSIYRKCGPEHLIENECGEGGDMVMVSEGLVIVDKEVNYAHAIAEVEKMSNFDRFIYYNNDDVSLYHTADRHGSDVARLSQALDSHDSGKHHHLKFHSLLTHDGLQLLLTILSYYQLMSADESTTFLRAFDARYETHRAQLDRVTRAGVTNELRKQIDILERVCIEARGILKQCAAEIEVIERVGARDLMLEEKERRQEANIQKISEERLTKERLLEIILAQGDKASDMRSIVQLIRSISDNDILVNLHQYLLEKKFDYLRLKLGLEIFSNRWQGLNRNGGIEDTTYCWAVIEKAFTLQIAHNVQAGSRQFTAAVGDRYSQQLAQYRFFAKPHRSGSTKETSRVFDAFARGDGANLDEKYRKMFK
ncbi:MAG: hypothetical protein A3E84_01115 [Gammaproteobacteria bacterium RIFCSPHIGHO2_12_FULL_42_13]|nr:MAG: hypothetical protein A3E84_01115 [Gammaproteobacteria bacterium RIFCSPHIGHO2_12_FULL_42_13]